MANCTSVPSPFSMKQNLICSMGGSCTACMQLCSLIFLLPQGTLNCAFRKKGRELHHSSCCQEASYIAQHWKRIRCPADNGSNPKVDEQGAPQRSKQKRPNPFPAHWTCSILACWKLLCTSDVYHAAKLQRLHNFGESVSVYLMAQGAENSQTPHHQPARLSA